jgi:hypothetical protein
LNTNLVDFLKSGQLGNIELGLPKAEIYKLLGKPDEWTQDYVDTTQEQSSWWRYGMAGLNFDDENCIKGLGLYWLIHPDIELPSLFHFSGWLPGKNTTIDEFVSFLGINNIIYQTIKNGRNKGNLITSGSVLIVAGRSPKYATPRLASVVRMRDIHFST